MQMPHNPNLKLQTDVLPVGDLSAPLLTMRNMVKSFPGVQALRGVDLTMFRIVNSGAVESPTGATSVSISKL